MRKAYAFVLSGIIGLLSAKAFSIETAKQSRPDSTEFETITVRDAVIMEPGEKYSYSNSNYNLLAYIIEKVTGKSYGEFLRETVFIPLGMLDTGHRADMAALLKNRASGYVPIDSNHVENAPYLDWSIKTGNGSLYSTVEDLYKWDRAFYSEKILKKSSLEKIFKDHLEGKGYGWFIRERIGRKVTSINGRSPGFSSYLERYIDDDACIIILSNNYAAAPVFDDPRSGCDTLR